MNDYLVISRGHWDERSTREEVQRAIDWFIVAESPPGWKQGRA